MHYFRKKSSSPATPTNGPPPTPTPSIVKYVKELVASHPRVKDKRTLAASPSNIGLSVVSPSCDPTDTALSEPGSSKESAWKAAYGAARMAVEIANASSDMILPLKAVVGALSVLIKNYDQTTANADQIREIEERVQSLSEILTYPVSYQDDEEKARREFLRQKLVGIVVRLGPLDEQHEFMRFLKNVDHANILNGFVKELAYAITDYQTSLQQSIHKNTARIDKVTYRIENTTRKISETTDRIEENADRVDETLNKIDETADRIDEATDKVDKTTRNINKTANRVNETANKIDETAKRIEETTRRVDESAQNIIGAADLELLGKLNPVHNAGYQAGHHDTCLRGTRESVLDGIIRWAKDPQDRHVFWLNGLAGTGKSTIAQTFSEMVAKAGILGASFFCSRDYLDRKELKSIFPTLAYQLACRYPVFRRHIIRVIKEDPSVATNSLISQLEKLIVGPLSSSNISCVIVIDALDECVDDQPASAILSVLGRYVKLLLPVKCFITGRPEPRIRSGFRLPLLEPFTQIFLLHEVKLSTVDEDIRLYLQEKLTAVAKRRSDFDLPDPWPCGKDLVAITKKSSGLFIFASTLVRFIESEHHEPNERLQLVIIQSDSTIHEGRAGIDPLYTQILVHAFLNVKDTAVFTNLKKVLGAVALAFNPLSLVQIAAILGVGTPLITRSLRHLHSVLLIPAEDSKEIRVFHKSFPDFLQDPDRCPDPRFFINSRSHHGEIALGCLELLKKLKPNPCGLPDYVMNQDVSNLPKLLEEKVGGATRYACSYWAMHARSSPTTIDYAVRLISSATEFFKKNVVPWIEVMSLENRLGNVIHNIYNLLGWLGEVNLLVSVLRSLAKDFLRFTMHFFHPIQQSASHIYHSALPLLPTSSPFDSRTFLERTRIVGFHGRPDAWGVVVRTIVASYKPSTYVTTFGHNIAIACHDGTVAIYDSVTGVLRLSLNPTDPILAMNGSKDGSMLFCAHQRPSVTLWDIQTGGLIHTFISERTVEDIAISSKGRYIACRLLYGTVNIWEVATKMKCAPIRDDLPITYHCWLEPEEQLAVTIEASVYIRDIVSSKVLRHFTVLDPTIRGMVYSQELDKLIVLTGSAVDIIHPLRGLSSTSHGIRQRISCIALSPTTKQFVCGTESHGLEMFDISKRRWRHFQYPGRITFTSFLPDGTVVAEVVGSGIQILSLDDGHAASQQPILPLPTVRAFDQDRIIAFPSASRDRIILLELATMSQLSTIPPYDSLFTYDTEILCASLEYHMVVYCCKEQYCGYLELRDFHHETLRWAVKTDTQPSIGRISPSGTWLVTYEVAISQGIISARNARNGNIQARLSVVHQNPYDITFDSKTRFYLHHIAYRISYVFSSSEPENGSHSLRDISRAFFPSHSITCLERLPLFEELRSRFYDVDNTREWVIGDSKRICWIPSGYIGSGRPSYWWFGHSLVMIGQDGKLRKLTFQVPF